MFRHKSNNMHISTVIKTTWKVEVCFYISQYHVRWTYTATLADTFIPTLTRLLWEAFYPRRNYARRLITHISPIGYSQVLIYTTGWNGASWIERKCPNFETVAKEGYEPMKYRRFSFEHASTCSDKNICVYAISYTIIYMIQDMCICPTIII